MSLLLTFHELDKLYESAWLDRETLIKNIESTGRDYDYNKYSDAQLYRMWERIQKEEADKPTEPVPAKRTYKHCDRCGSQLADNDTCPECHDFYDEFARYKEELETLGESTEVSTISRVGSVVDTIKQVYEAGLFNKLPVGRHNAFTTDIYGPDKERLVAYFEKQPEFNYELNNDNGIISHEFISHEYDIEIFDTFVLMYKIPQNESLEESSFDLFMDTSNKSNWVKADGTAVKTSSTSQAAKQPAQTTQAAHSNVVTIVYDYTKHKLRAQADDGIHGAAWVAFPSNLRNTEGQKYDVEELIWNGKNYRASGEIKPISTNVANAANIQTVNETINKETYEMNFQTILEELDRLYEEDQQVKVEEATETDEVSEECTEGCTKEAAETMTEEVDEADRVEETKETAEEDEEILVDDEPIIDDEKEETEEPVEINDPVEEKEATEATTQFVLECAKCGAIIIKTAGDTEVKENGTVETDEACQYCNEGTDYKVVGTVVPYEVSEAIEDEQAEEEKTEDAEETVDEIIDETTKEAIPDEAVEELPEDDTVEEVEVVDEDLLVRGPDGKLTTDSDSDRWGNSKEWNYNN